MSHVMLCHLTSLEPKIHERLSENMAAVFAGQPLTQAFYQIIVYHLLKQLLLRFWSYVSCQSTNSCAMQLNSPKRKTGNGGDTSPTAAPSLPSRALGVSLSLRLLSHQAPHFPWINVHLLSVSHSSENFS